MLLGDPKNRQANNEEKEKYNNERRTNFFSATSLINKRRFFRAQTGVEMNR